MQLTFESLAELQDFVQWIGALTPIKTVTVGGVSVSAPASDQIFQEVLQVVADAAEPAEAPAQPREAADKPARKRRTKAEMEAARAAEIAEEEALAAAEAFAETASEAVAETSASPSGPDVDEAEDIENFMRARLKERPEVSQVEHLNLARTFIGKHGMEKYNASFPLAGLTPNVMGYSPADCATHAAALDFLSLE